MVAFASSFIDVWIFKELHRGHVTAYFKDTLHYSTSKYFLSSFNNIQTFNNKKFEFKSYV